MFLNLLDQKVFMINMNWSQQYTQYLKESNKVPQTIDNQTLLQLYKIKTLKQDYDYVRVNHPTWIFLVRLYGGGPEVIYKNTIAKIQNQIVQDSLNQKLFVKPIGITNKSSYDYYISILQSILSIDLMVDYFKDEQYLNIRNSQKPFQFCLLLSNLLSEINKCQSKSINSKQFRRNCKRYFNKNMQHDAFKFISFLFQELKMELRQQSSVEINQDLPAQEFWDQQMQIQGCILDKCFSFQIQTIRICEVCAGIQKQFDILDVISISIDKQKPLTLFSQLKPYFQQKKEKIFCDKCNSKQIVTTQLTLNQLPKILVIHLKRFENIFDEEYIQFPKNLKIEEFVLNTDQLFDYSLKSFIQIKHTKNGVYSYSSFSQRNQQWYHFNDSEVTTVDIDNILSQEQIAYIFLYEQNF